MSELLGLDMNLRSAREILDKILRDGHKNNLVEPVDPIPKTLIACMPKSGSTWFSSVFEKLHKGPILRCYLQPDRNEQEIDPLALLQAAGREVLFVQQHIKASETTLRLCNAFSTKIVVLTRNLADAVVSFRDHLETESTIASMFYMEDTWFQELTVDRQLNFLIEHCVPWYLNFYVGWLRAFQNNPGKILIIHYEDLVENPKKTFDELGVFLGKKLNLRKDVFEIRDSQLRFNQGRIGRGKNILSQYQINKINQMASYYNNICLKSIGVDSPVKS